MYNLYETIQRIVQQELQQIRTAELAVVQEIHPHESESDKDNYACTVVLRNSGLVLNKVPLATHRIGAVCVPDVGEMVLVQFLGGDVNAPVLTGRVYNDEDRPPMNKGGQSVLHLPLGAEDQDAVHIELHSQEKREFIFKLGSGLVLNMKDDDPVVKLDIDDGKVVLQIDRDGTVGLESKGDVSIKGAEVSVEASGTLTLKGATVNIN